MLSKRRKRRQRHAIRKRLQALDVIAEKNIHRSITWWLATWGGTRCPDCGQTCRPHHLADLSCVGPGIHITAYDSACDYIKCPGPREW